MTATLSAPHPITQPVRIRRVPALEPPADDDRRADDHPVCAGQLALFTSVQSARTGSRTAKPPAATNGYDRLTGRSGDSARNGPSGSATTAATLPTAAHIAANRFVAACVEVLNGFRPAAHLRALTAPFDYATVVKRLTGRAVRARVPATGRDAGERVGLRRLRVFEQRAGIAEAVAVLHHGDESWAIALRFERRLGSWLCTLFEVI